MWNVVAGVGLFPEFVALDGSGEILRDNVVVVGLDIELFPFAGALAPIECLLCVLESEPVFAHVAVGLSHGGVGHGEVGIELNGVFEKGQGLRFRAAAVEVPGGGVGLEGLKR